MKPLNHRQRNRVCHWIIWKLLLRQPTAKQLEESVRRNAIYNGRLHAA